MSLEAAEALLAHAENAGRWPLPAEAPILERLNTWAALRDGDHHALRTIRGWDARRQYRIDPLPELIADAWAHYLMGEEPAVRPANDADQALLNELLEANQFASELERAAALCVSEGEIWARVYVDELVAPRPLLDWISRRNILPLWIGPRLAAAAVITELPAPAGTAKGTVYRHFEVHAAGVVLNALYVGKAGELGARRPLDEHADTASLEELWTHGLSGLLLTRIPNRVRGNRRVGISDYHGILDTLLDINEAAAIGAHNMRLTARKRAVISQGIAQAAAGVTSTIPNQATSDNGVIPRARFDAGEEIFVEDPLDTELGRTSSPLRILEYSFDATALIEWKRDLVETALTRVGLAPQYVGTHSPDGYAISGTALRLRLIPTDSTGRAKARYWDDALPRLLATMAQLDGGPLEQQGFGRAWQDPITQPTVERQPGLPPDYVEEAQRHSTLVTAGIESIETAVRQLHPDWTDENVLAEVDRIREDRAAGAAIMPTGF